MRMLLIAHSRSPGICLGRERGRQLRRPYVTSQAAAQCRTGIVVAVEPLEAVGCARRPGADRSGTVPARPLRWGHFFVGCEDPLANRHVHKAGSDFFAGIAPSLPVKALSDSPRPGLSFGTCC
jgi:hypothetical protein